jgi:hypothetical protein
MKMTAAQALDIAIAGDWAKAWEIAQQDEGLLPDATFEQWKAWAIKAIERRNSLFLDMPAAYYS